MEEYPFLLPLTRRLLFPSHTISNVLGAVCSPDLSPGPLAQQEDTDDCKFQQLWLAGPGVRLPDLSIGQLVGPFTLGASALPSVKWAAHVSGWRRHLVGIQMFVASRCPSSSVLPSNSPILCARGCAPLLSVGRAFL